MPTAIALVLSLALMPGAALAQEDPPEPEVSEEASAEQAAPLPPAVQPPLPQQATSQPASPQQAAPQQPMPQQASPQQVPPQAGVPHATVPAVPAGAPSVPGTPPSVVAPGVARPGAAAPGAATQNGPRQNGMTQNGATHSGAAPQNGARQYGAAPAVAAPGALAPNTDTRADDDNFLLLREAVRQNDAARAHALASRLPNYSLASYVDYYRLKPRLRDAAPEEIHAALQRHAGTAVAERLRADWLLELGRRRDWSSFEREMGKLARDDDLQIRCYALVARAGRGERVGAEARALLNNPPAYGEGCAALMAELAQRGELSEAELLWQLRLAGEMNATGPARRTAALLGASDTRAAQAVDVPAVALARGIGNSRAERQIYLVALGRMARTSLKLAVVALEKNAPRLSSEERAIGWANVALAASIVLSPEASAYWRRTNGAQLTNEQMQWKTRIALRNGDWKQVRSSIEAMPAALRAENAWVYWLGRAYKAEGRGDEARALFEKIAVQSHFYGQLAMEELGRMVTAPPPAAPVTAAELAQAGANPSLHRALKFYALRLRAEGNREWNWALRGMSERQLLAVGEFARRNQLLDRMVETSLRTRTELDYAQRFPAPHFEILHPTAQGLGLDKAWVYGLIRQESRFIQDARSGVGASGLMQVMPATGKWVATKIGLDNFVHDMLTDLRTNITLGANYMNMVLGNFDGSQVLATAAYNAGPGRARAWRGLLTEPMEGAVFVETIPFSETRGYVRNVMANATNYAAVFEQRPQSIKARLATVNPRSGSVLD
ncbi:transglycosylase SLT domain-containing protein [Massilia niastensis]|uniref:transglycosylase SLT domain-containing protein n=1 Tax=Massilia niastensis TaxID=544911 RepID=UPI0003741C31|nr:transglycosylase SLT domain-containing protein [Massilia niastensis]